MDYESLKEEDNDWKQHSESIRYNVGGYPPADSFVKVPFKDALSLV